ncbi:MAG: response regulator [Acidobacteriota bacterium]
MNDPHAPAESASPTDAPRRILVIDDEADLLEFLQVVLSRSGYAVDTAANGTDGLIRAHVETPDLILLDIMMQDMDGWETLRLLRLDEACADIPVIILSARSAPRDKIRALQEGAVDYFTKPFDLQEGLGRIAAILDETGDAA